MKTKVQEKEIVENVKTKKEIVENVKTMEDILKV